MSFVLSHQRQAILDDWLHEVRRIPIARELDPSSLLDHAPGFFDGIVDMVVALEAKRTPELPFEAAAIHAGGRLGRGFDLSQVVTEICILRDCIIARILDHGSRSIRLQSLRVLNIAIDNAITASVMRYTELRDRDLSEFDESVRRAIEEPDLERVLQNLLGVLRRMTPGADTAAILLRDGDVLRVRAAVGIERDRAFSVRVGQGFAGTVAAEGRALSLSSASTHPLVVNPAIRVAGVNALYGVPLVDGGSVIGVMHVGSLTLDKFTPQDHHLVEAVASRAHAAIYQLMLREAAEESARRWQESENKLQAIADNIPQLAWMADSTGALTWINKGWSDFTGLTQEAAIGTGWLELQHPEHRDRVVRRLEQSLAAGVVWEDLSPMRSKTGRYRWFLTRAVPIRASGGEIASWFGTHTDVTEHRCLAEASRLLGSSLDDHDTLERLARLVVPDIADWCLLDVIDDTGPRQLAVAHSDPSRTESARTWAKSSPHLWRESSVVARVIRTGQAELVPEITDAMLADFAHDPEELEALRAEHLVSLIAVPLISRGQTHGALTLVTAESERRFQPSDLERAMELGRLAGVAIDNARLYAEARNEVQLRQRILAIVSHDLRGPLSTIDLSAGLLLEDPTHDPRTRKPLELIVRSAARMQHMIGDLLDLVRVQSGSLKLDLGPRDACELLSSSVESHDLLAREKDIRLEAECDLRGCMVSCDRDRIEQVFANLLGNALKFCRAGDTIVVRGRPEGGRVRYEIEDTGPGIAPDALPHIFEPYWSDGSHAKEGLGLGLYICKAIVQAHGGEMWAESRPGHGATFVVRLPMIPG